MSHALPLRVAEGVQELVAERTGVRPRTLTAAPVGGGCVHHAHRVQFDSGPGLFLKWSTDSSHEVFEQEARGLRALADRSPLRVPEVLGVSRPEDSGPAWLALEYVPRGSGSPTYDARLGRGLAELHSAPCGVDFGWPDDNYVGPLPQHNRPLSDWSRFWGHRRIRPQLKLASAHLIRSDRDRFSELLGRLPALLGPVSSEGPSLIHGDLWSGNVYPDTDGRPVLVDPAVYRGHREVDLAMMELFGGFSRTVFESYSAAAPLLPGYPEVRRNVYQLYPLLVHVNLFGTGYLGRLRAALHGALATG